MMNHHQQKKLLERLTKLTKETEWVEFKVDYVDEEDIGEYISALANSGCLKNQDYGYLVYGVKDKSHEIVGTKFKPKQYKIGNQELENWLATQLEPRIDFIIYEFNYEGHDIAIFQIDSATNTPVRFRNFEYIRIGSYKKKMKEHPEKERKLWDKVSSDSFEEKLAMSGLGEAELLDFLDYPSYFDLTNQQLPTDRKNIIERLKEDGLVVENKGKLAITNLGATLFAKDISEFVHLNRKSVRVIIYDGKNKNQTIREQNGIKGYANGFEGLISWIVDKLPQHEVIENAMRKEVKMYPEIAIRELVANALIHQDFEMTGTNPMVEVYSDRIEITNNGKPLVDPLRFIGATPRSRNEKLASFMRRVNICEERGSGIVKVILATESFKLPAPNFRVDENHFIATLYAYKPLSEMDRKGKIRACYQHTCLKFVSNEKMTNKSLRERFEIKQKKLFHGFKDYIGYQRC